MGAYEPLKSALGATNNGTVLILLPFALRKVANSLLHSHRAFPAVEKDHLWLARGGGRCSNSHTNRRGQGSNAS